MAFDTISEAHRKFVRVLQTLLGRWNTQLLILERPKEATIDACGNHFATAVENDRIVSGGISGVVELLPCGHVRKVPLPSAPEYRSMMLNDLAREYEVYQRLGRRSHFLQVIDYDKEHGIVFPYISSKPLRSWLKSDGDKYNLSARIRWATQAAQCLQTLHSLNIIHADMKPENMLIDDELYLYVIDFSGSGIDEKPNLIIENTRFCKPRHRDANASVETDFFALGSTIYEIMTGVQPYKDLTDEEIEEFYGNGVFPNTDCVPCGDVIQKCWRGELQTAEEAYQGLLGHLEESMRTQASAVTL